MKEFITEQIRPFIRYAQLIKIDEGMPFKNVAAYDWRMFFVRDGSGEFVVDNTVYSAKKGTLILWGPGSQYSILSKGDSMLSLIGFNFDLAFLNSHIKSPVPPVGIDKFIYDEIIEKNDLNFFGKVIYLNDRHDIEFELLKIYTEYKNKLSFFEHKMSGMFLSVLTEILRTQNQTGNNMRKNENIEKILDIIKENYNKPLTNKLIGKKIGYHPNHANRLLVAYTGMSLHKYLQNYRIEKAIDLLQTTDMSVTQICEAVGFRDFTHFSKYFKKKTGHTPTAFRLAETM